MRAVKLDPLTIVMMMAAATTRIGLGATYSTTYYEPFHVARVFATLDHMLGGRAAWNVVTSLNDSEAHNMGADDHLEHDLRYDRADEFMEIVLSHWDSWGDEAIIQDRESGVFADADAGDFGIGIDDGGDEIPVHVAGFLRDPFGDGDAVFLGFVREHEPGGHEVESARAQQSLGQGEQAGDEQPLQAAIERSGG